MLMRYHSEHGTEHFAECGSENGTKHDQPACGFWPMQFISTIPVYFLVDCGGSGNRILLRLWPDGIRD